MSYGPAAVSEYERWFTTPAGRFAYEQERRLLAYLMSRWPRRKQKLLEIGCGPGLFLRSFYDAGFDVTGLDASADMLKSARNRIGLKADLHLGRAEHLPFDDNDFDFAVLLTVLEFCDDPGQALAEAGRVARKGIIVGYLNRGSIYFYTHGGAWPWSSRKSMLRQASWLRWKDVRSLMSENLGTARISARSVLPGPTATWRDTWWCKLLNGRICPVWIGAYACARADFVDETPLTPLFMGAGAEPSR